MGSTVVHVIIEDGTMLLGIVQKTHHLRTYHRIDGEKRTKDYHVIRLHFGIYKVKLVVEMVFIKNILGIVLFIEKGQ